jgi:hypothetical protein
VETALTIIVWIAAVAITLGVGYVVFLLLRWPVRVWRRGEQRRAVLIGIAVALVLFVWFEGSQVAP